MFAYFGEPTPPSSCKAKREENDKNRSLGENKKATLDYEISKAKQLPRIQDEKDDAMNISVLVPQSLFEHSRSTFMWEKVGLNPPNPSLYPIVYPQIHLPNFPNTQYQIVIQ